MIDLQEAEKTRERLKAYPSLLKQLKGMIDLIEEKEKVESADDFEEALIPQVRKLGKEIVQVWATEAECTLRKDLEKQQRAHHCKKNSTGIQPLEE